jgi:hypothetical protein
LKGYHTLGCAANALYPGKLRQETVFLRPDEFGYFMSAISHPRPSSQLC